MQIFRVAAGLDGGTSEACRATFPNVQLRAVGGVSGGTKRGLPSDTFKMLDLGWLVGLVVVTERGLLSDTFRTFKLGW